MEATALAGERENVGREDAGSGKPSVVPGRHHTGTAVVAYVEDLTGDTNLDPKHSARFQVCRYRGLEKVRFMVVSRTVTNRTFV